MGKDRNYTDPVDGKRYLVKRNLFGKIIERISVEDIPKQSDRNIISATCCSCGNKYVLFDNSMHGYNAFAEQSVGNELIEFAEIVKKQAQSGRFIVKIKIFNDSSLDAFAENTGEEISLEQYSEAFSDITIYGYSEESGNKRILIHSEETA